MADLKVSVAGVEFHNPLIAASGTNVPWVSIPQVIPALYSFKISL